MGRQLLPVKVFYIQKLLLQNHVFNNQGVAATSLVPGIKARRNIIVGIAGEEVIEASSIRTPHT